MGVGILNCPVLTRLGKNMKKPRVISLSQGTPYLFFPSFLNKLENGGVRGEKRKEKITLKIEFYLLFFSNFKNLSFSLCWKQSNDTDFFYCQMSWRRWVDASKLFTSLKREEKPQKSCQLWLKTGWYKWKKKNSQDCCCFCLK